MKTATAEQLDRMFDAGEDMMEYLDLEHAVLVNPQKTEVKRVNVDFPRWMVNDLDKQADRLAINRQAVIKTWIAERLKEEQLV